jgi:glutamyl-tRNA synthetase
VLTPQARGLLYELSHELGRVNPWTVETTEELVRAFAGRSGMKLGNIAQPLRVALTGRITSPPIFEVLAVLGKDESLARIADQVAPVGAHN